METSSFENAPPAAINDAQDNNINTETNDQETNQQSIETRDAIDKENGAQTETGENSAKNAEQNVSSTNLNNAPTNGALDDDVIPNAIVIKNIPFAIKKEQLLDIIEEMDLPLPYAFNYHFDNGIFRGLAFANFTTPEETTQVITSLNGKEISGRKLKVEYKKMLPQAERERIEREKREKRGQLEEQHRSSSNLSLHSLSKMSGSGNNNTSNNQLFSTLMNGINTNSMMNSPMNNTINNNSSNNNNSGNIILNQPSLSAQHTSSSLYQTNFNNQTQMSTERFYAPLPSTSTLPLPPQQLDFNDPDTLEIYSQLLLFKDREKYYYELAYPMGISASHKRIINVLCSYLGLVEVYDPRFIIIRRKILDHANLQSHLQQQGQMTSAHPLQPNSTGGSMNRSQSYTSLLQAHAAAAANSISNQAVNNSSNSNTINSNNGNGNNVIINNNSASSTPKISSQGQFSMQPTLTSPKMNIHHNSQYNSADQPQQSQPQTQQNVQSAAQQQQSFLRQQATLTPSSRIPSGYSANHYQINSVNPLLRNSQISPPNSQIPINSQSLSQAQPPAQSQTQQRVPVAYQNASLSSQQLYNLNGPSSANSQSQLLPQHTNGSVHSNFSYQSYHDESMLSAHNLNSADLIYKSLSHSGLDDGLEQGLNRSLSGLDLQNQNKKNLW
ncbi:AEH_G0001440.mRNA.1.CDS.1 [Saccharomyces cerevisiae]|uniref:Pin4p n=1 Tax=Saccharomyces cerevisiae (strain JAY291) TaxID=574961 RepID=C7GNB3_YEAS2|nr:Pin4p [Saccharomyces cerevisiae JAY291]CAE6453042.1 Pin4p [Saccharomyces cerevisiae PE-2]CAI4245774.1 CNB_1a_G0001430.mRNA.1.CDS.1 [Saccharomyces cerevisiae]CAF1543016.1 Pin4p [Saccharomyces cerevisiae PE-2]CAI4252430.1 AEH_G0001440.mRNA.1.CDS.1 [Saccharomyces cerevisiae]